ncbi:hypothetical protein AK812_SmicGene46561 [Symbiodinium microadriaticum]|uniref:Uncharacterized protein n=1 Tax=Symbiodinium microadriaticum TaxID=2951 RepID=A0A1Q9BTR3_SYMMI|nr:hypothetical protein AK812_SmicGene46561 [Symbiodinium microadriaticum]
MRTATTGGGARLLHAIVDCATDSGGSSSMPLVYAAALEGIETHGWSAVYPLDDPPAWTILHWAAMEGRLEICRRLLAAGANPFCEYVRTWEPCVRKQHGLL